MGFAAMAVGAVGALVNGRARDWLPLRFASVVFSAVVVIRHTFLMAVRLAPSENTVTTTVGPYSNGRLWVSCRTSPAA